MIVDYAQAVARVLSARIAQAKTTTARATVTAVTSDGFVTFTDALGATRKGVWLSQQPLVGDVITYLDEGSGFPLVLGTSGDRAWSTVTFANGWVQYADATYGTVGYRKVGDLVYLRGLMSSGTIGLEAFILPSGFRPPLNVAFPVVSNNAFGRVNVFNSGLVLVEVGSNAWVSLDGLLFSTTT